VSDGFFRRRVAGPILGQLRQGVSPKKLALSVALGVALGLFPLIGTTTVLCVLAGYCLGLNQVSLQLVNQLMWPFQVPLVLFFVRAGEKIFGAEAVPLAPAALTQEFMAGPMLFLKSYGMAGVHGVTAWALAAPLLAATVYVVLAPLFHRAAAAAKQRFGGA